MPEVIVAGLPNALGWWDAPLPHQEWHQFPFPAPLGQPPLSHTLHCKKLEAALIKTQQGVTETAGQIMNMPREDRLGHVRRCNTLFQNLATYGTLQGLGVATVVPQVLQQMCQGFILAVQDEVHAQIIELLGFRGVKINAGFPDFLLYMGSQPKQNTAIIEVKTCSVAAVPGTGTFSWTKDETTRSLFVRLSIGSHYGSQYAYRLERNMYYNAEIDMMLGVLLHIELSQFYDNDNHITKDTETASMHEA
ncbi:hypothetical protein JB92DRAFT_3190429 [Gautieria morchelliformis]|nr:hypothetical protein JB92DRAFT_3190429 [Gautieria morchelliformis]